MSWSISCVVSYGYNAAGSFRESLSTADWTDSDQLFSSCSAVSQPGPSSWWAGVLSLLLVNTFISLWLHAWVLFFFWLRLLSATWKVDSSLCIVFSCCPTFVNVVSHCMSVNCHACIYDLLINATFSGIISVYKLWDNSRYCNNDFVLNLWAQSLSPV